MTSRLGDIELGAMPPSSPRREAPPPKSGCSRCCGFIWADWTQVVGRIGVLGGLIAGGVGIAISSPYVVAGGVASVVVGYLFPDIQISCKKPAWDLDHTVQHFGEGNQELEAQVKELTSQVEELTRNREALAGVLKEAQAEVGELRDVLDKKTAALEDVAGRLKATEEKLEVIQQLYVQFKKSAAQFSRDIAVYNKANKVFKGEVSNLSLEVDRFGKDADSFVIEMGQVEDLNVFYQQQNKDLQALMGSLDQNVSSLQQRFSEMRQALNELAQQTQTLDVADDKFVGAADKLEKLTPVLDRILGGFQDLIGNVETVPKVGGSGLIKILEKDDGSRPASSVPVPSSSGSKPKADLVLVPSGSEGDGKDDSSGSL